MRKTMLLVGSGLMLLSSACADMNVNETEQDLEQRGDKGERGAEQPSYVDFREARFPLFSKENRAPVAFAMNDADGDVVMFGYDGSTGAFDFAYYSTPRGFANMANAAQEETALYISLPGSGEDGVPFLPKKGPGGGGPIGDPWLEANKAFSLNLNNAFNDYAGALPPVDGEFGDKR